MEPSSPPRAGWLRQSGLVLARVWHKVFDDRVLGLAAEAGFWGLVSLPSLALAVFGALGYFRGVIGPVDMNHIQADVLRAASDILTPQTVQTVVAPLVTQVLAKGDASVVSVGFLISLWSGSTAMSDYLNTITVAYGMRGLRGAVRSRLVALGLYLVALLAGIVLLPALALGPDLIADLFPASAHHIADVAVHVAYFPLVAFGSVAVLALVYKACLPAPIRWRRALPGATVAMTLWVGFSFAVRAYLSSGFRNGSLYGSLSAPIAGLLFFYFTALAVLLGAELNAALDAVRPDAVTDDARARSLLKRRRAEATELFGTPGISPLRSIDRDRTDEVPRPAEGAGR